MKYDILVSIIACCTTTSTIHTSINYNHTIHIFISVITDTCYIAASRNLSPCIMKKTIRQNSHGLNFVVQPLEEKQNTSKKL